jgi:hypothetical protein
MEVIWVERKVKVITLSTVLIAAILSGIAVMAYANGLNNGESTEPAVMLNDFGYCGGAGPIGRRGFGWGVGPITVSQEFKDNVISIAQNDTDVQNLLADGYNITDVRPIINTVVGADGTVTMKATTAIVMLNQNTTGRAFATVNVEAGKVTEIVILTRTVIEKP